MKSSHFRGKSSDFLCKSVGKSSDDADFIKSMDLSDLSEDLQIFGFLI